MESATAVSSAFAPNLVTRFVARERAVHPVERNRREELWVIIRNNLLTFGLLLL
jgi:hypothetical protein